MTIHLFISNSNGYCMKKFVIKSLLMVFVTVIVASVTMITRSNDWSKSSHEINVSLAYHRLDSLKSVNKIVIVTGSNGGFGIDSGIIADSMNMPVVNTSTHAGIGVRMQFEMYKELLQKGDIVVFCPEYYEDISRLYGECTLYRILSTHMPSAYMKLTFMQWIHTFKYIGTHFREALKGRGIKEFSGPYSASAVNKYGDISFYRTHKDIKSIYGFHGNMDMETTTYYQYIHEYSKKKCIKLIYLPPTLMESNYINQKKQIDSLELFMVMKHIPFQAKPERFVLNDTLYFDSPYHLTSRGARIRTLILIEEIKRILHSERET